MFMYLGAADCTDGWRRRVSAAVSQYFNTHTHTQIHYRIYMCNTRLYCVCMCVCVRECAWRNTFCICVRQRVTLRRDNNTCTVRTLYGPMSVISSETRFNWTDSRVHGFISDGCCNNTLPRRLMSFLTIILQSSPWMGLHAGVGVIASHAAAFGRGARRYALRGVCTIKTFNPVVFHNVIGIRVLSKSSVWSSA